MIFQKLNAEKEKLVTDNIELVKWVIREFITVNEHIVGFGFDDLYQEGCIWLCKAADTYDGVTAKFVTYARVVVRNGLLSYCRKMYVHEELPISLDDEAASVSQTIAVEDDPDSRISEIDVLRLLESVKPEYSGVAKLGIEALELKVKGYSGAEIAAMYNVKQNLVGAWVSRAAEKLRANEKFLAGLGE